MAGVAVAVATGLPATPKRKGDGGWPVPITRGLPLIAGHGPQGRGYSDSRLLNQLYGCFSLERMRATLHFLLCLVTTVAIAVAVVPARATIPQVVKTNCCAMMMNGPADDCSHQAPKSEQENDCLRPARPASLSSSPRRHRLFIRQLAGNLFPLFVREHVRSQRPPVPPPRA